MAGFEGGMTLALVDREQIAPKNSSDVSRVYVPPSREFMNANSNQEQYEKTQTILDTDFLTPEEKLTLLSEIGTDQRILLATNEDNPGDWKDLVLDIAKDLLVPDEMDLALLLMTGPEGPAIKKAFKLPEAIRKIVRYFEDPKAAIVLEKGFEELARGNPGKLEAMAKLLKDTPDPKRQAVAREIEKALQEAKISKPKEIMEMTKDIGHRGRIDRLSDLFAHGKPSKEVFSDAARERLLEAEKHLDNAVAKGWITKEIRQADTLRFLKELREAAESHIGKGEVPKIQNVQEAIKYLELLKSTK